jgi:hypothetical protein
VKYEETKYGFTFGPAEIERWISDDKKGWVVLGLKTKKFPDGIQIYVTKSGNVTVTYRGDKKSYRKKKCC